jgi:hypothetical protein
MVEVNGVIRHMFSANCDAVRSHSRLDMGEGNMVRRALMGCLSAALLGALLVSAQSPKDPGAKAPDTSAENLIRSTDRAAAEYKKFEDSLLRLVQRMRKSVRIEEQQKAETLQRAIDIANKEQVENRFHKLVSLLVGNKNLTTDELEKVAGENEEIVKILREMLNILLTDSELLLKQEEIRRLTELIKQVDAIIKAEKIEQTKMDGKRVPSDVIAKTQQGITKATESIARNLAGKKPDGDKPADSDAKKNDGKSGDAKPSDGKSGDAKPSDGKSGDAKPSDGKSGDAKPSDGKSGDAKSGDSSSPPNPSEKPNPGPESQNAKAQKQIQDAIESQKKIEEELKKDQRESASRHTDDAIAKLEELKKELERRLRQLREEELERLLANLQARCERMLAMQIEVQSGTKRVYSVIQSLPDKQATRVEEQQSQQLSSREAEIVREANRTLQLMSAEGSAVAFALSLEMVRDDMKVIEQRLDRYDVSEFTQQIEQDVIDALKEMIEALKKKRQELQQNKNNPSQPNNNPPPPQRLLDLLAELRLIRSQQLQINKRTIDYARHYQGEQADDPAIQKELEAIAKRQVRIEEMLKKIATGKNR